MPRVDGTRDNGVGGRLRDRFGAEHAMLQSIDARSEIRLSHAGGSVASRKLSVAKSVMSVIWLSTGFCRRMSCLTQLAPTSRLHLKTPLWSLLTTRSAS